MSILFGLSLIAASWLGAFLLIKRVGQWFGWHPLALFGVLLFGCSGSLVALEMAAR